MLDRNRSNRFANVAQSVDIPRSQIPINFKYHTTANVGTLYPMCAPIEVIPGDEWSISSQALSRMQTPLVPVMDSCILDTFYFFVPMRLTWSHTKHFFGESEVSGFDNNTVYEIPTVTGVIGEKTLGDYFGLPTMTKNDLEVSALQFRAYQLIWNNFFRDQNIQNAVAVNTGDTDSLSNLNVLRKVNKFHDYFTSCLPYPQKGPDVLLPMSGDASVYSGNFSVNPHYAALGGGTSYDGMTIPPTYFSNNGYIDYVPDGPNGYYEFASPHSDPEPVQSMAVDSSNFPPTNSRSPLNLMADLTNVNSATIVQLRQAFAVQRLYENFALHGSRYYEMLRGSFGVVAPEAYLQIPEYLGGSRTKVNMTQVTQVSGDGLGDNGAYSLTSLYNQDFTKTFVEHGWIIPVYCIRNLNSYQQGLHRQWSRRDMLDFYWPELANVGEQPVYTKELYTDGNNASDNSVFGYQERYAEYRYIPDQIAGEFRSNSSQSLDVYHYADYYNSAPTLSSSWLESTPVNVDRTISIPSSTSDQFYVDFAFNCVTRRKMPLFGGHSIQGWM